MNPFKYLALCLCRLFVLGAVANVKGAAADDPCKFDESGRTEVNCWRTTEEKGCPITARYDELYDLSIKCCCLCPGNRCTESGRHATQCHSEYCENTGQWTTTPTTTATTTTSTPTSVPSTPPTPSITEVSTASTSTSTVRVITTPMNLTLSGPDNGEEVTTDKTETVDEDGKKTDVDHNTVVKIVVPISVIVVIFIIVIVLIAIGGDRRQRLWNCIRCRTQNNERPASNINRSRRNTNGNSRVQYSEVRTNGDAHCTINADPAADDIDVEAASLEGQPSNGTERITMDTNSLNENTQGGGPDEDTGSLVNH